MRVGTSVDIELVAAEGLERFVQIKLEAKYDPVHLCRVGGHTASCLAHAGVLDLLKAGLAARNRGDFDSAINLFTQAIDTGSLSGPRLAAVLGSRGVMFDLKGETDRSIDDFDAAIRANADFGSAYIYRGLAWVKKRDYNRAIADFTEASSRDATYAFLALSNRGNVYNIIGEYDRAVEDFGHSIQLNPDYAEAHSNRGIAYLAKGEIDKALTDFGDAIRLDPADAVALTNRGNTYAANSQFERAIADFNSAIRLKPYSSWPYINRGRAELYLGQTPAAISDLGTAVRLSPTNAYAVIWLHLAHLQAAEDDSQQFRRDAANVDRNKWPGPIVDLYLGMASPEVVSTAAQVNLIPACRVSGPASFRSIWEPLIYSKAIGLQPRNL